MSTMEVRVAAKVREAEDICSYELVCIDGAPLPPFEAGAHIDVHVREGRVRQYSLCNAPHARRCSTWPKRWRRKAPPSRCTTAHARRSARPFANASPHPAFPARCTSITTAAAPARVLDGEPEHRDLCLTDEEHAANDQFMPCCSRAKSRLLVLDL